jgi:hypothetical protein
MPADGMHVAIELSRGTSARPTGNSENHYIASAPSTHQTRRNLREASGSNEAALTRRLLLADFVAEVG